MMSAESGFRYTPVPLRVCSQSIGYADASLWMGSCFTENLSPWLKSLGYPVLSNPFGVLFHPLIMEKLLFAEADAFRKYHFEREGSWLNFLLGAPFAAASEKDLHQQIEDACAMRDKALSKCNWLILTFGTAFLYEHKQLGPAGKCHKLPPETFSRRLSSAAEISEVWKEAIGKLRLRQPDLKILFTLSPVRHTRDGLEENTVSKAILRLAIEELRNELPSVHYFPAFELMNDELRDYRFYGSDLIHPSEEAIHFLRKQFELRFLKADEKPIRRLAEEIRQMEQHRPQAGWSQETARWKESLEEKRRQLIKLLPENSGF